MPSLRRVLTLVDPNDPRTERPLKEYRDAAAQLHDRSSWTSGKPRARRISRGSSDRCGPERSTAHSSCRTTSRQNHSALTDQARQARAAAGPGAAAKSGSSRARSSRTGSISRRSAAPARATSTASSGARRLPTCQSRTIPNDRVRHQSQDRRQARHQGAAGHDHPRLTRSTGSRGHDAARQRGTARAAAPAPDLEVHGGRRDARRRGDRLGRAHGALLHLSGQQAHAERASSGTRLRRPPPSIEQQIQEILRELEAVAQPTVETGRAGLAERNQDFHRLLERDAFVSRAELPRRGWEGTGPHLPAGASTASTAGSTSPGARSSSARGPSNGISGRVYFEGARPHMTISVAERAPGRGVVVAEIDLRSVREVIERARVGTAGYAYAVDSRGRAHHPS